MKTEHYPSLELCKKLTSNGFTKTENRIRVTDDDGYDFEEDFGVCPSVMELLDEMPQSIIKSQLTHGLSIYKRDFGENLWQVCYYNNGSGIYRRDTLPNALAEMWLWLRENNYLIK